MKVRKAWTNVTTELGTDQEIQNLTGYEIEVATVPAGQVPLADKKYIVIQDRGRYAVTNKKVTDDIFIRVLAMNKKDDFSCEIGTQNFLSGGSSGLGTVNCVVELIANGDSSVTLTNADEYYPANIPYDIKSQKNIEIDLTSRELVIIHSGFYQFEASGNIETNNNNEVKMAIIVNGNLTNPTYIKQKTGADGTIYTPHKRVLQLNAGDRIRTYYSCGTAGKILTFRQNSFKVDGFRIGNL